VAHEAVVEHFLRAPAVLPMQLFTIFTSDERALEHIAQQRRRVDRIFARIERQQEWGLRSLVRLSGVRVQAVEEHTGPRRCGPRWAARSRVPRISRASAIGSTSPRDS
jgi:hypothetical protein